MASFRGFLSTTWNRSTRKRSRIEAGSDKAVAKEGRGKKTRNGYHSAFFSYGFPGRVRSKWCGSPCGETPVSLRDEALHLLATARSSALCAKLGLPIFQLADNRSNSSNYRE